MPQNWVALARKCLGFNQRELADFLGVTIVTVSRWENGHRNPKNEVLLRLADALKVSPGELIDGKIYKEKLCNKEAM